MQIRAVMRHHLTTVTMAITKRQQVTSCGEKATLFYWLVGM